MLCITTKKCIEIAWISISTVFVSFISSLCFFLQIFSQQIRKYFACACDVYKMQAIGAISYKQSSSAKSKCLTRTIYWKVIGFAANDTSIRFTIAHIFFLLFSWFVLFAFFFLLEIATIKLYSTNYISQIRQFTMDAIREAHCDRLAICRHSDILCVFKCAKQQ